MRAQRDWRSSRHPHSTPTKRLAGPGDAEQVEEARTVEKEGERERERQRERNTDGQTFIDGKSQEDSRVKAWNHGRQGHIPIVGGFMQVESSLSVGEAPIGVISGA